MENFSELSGLKQWGILVLGGVVLSAALYFTMFKSQQAANETGAEATGRQGAGERRARTLSHQAG